MKYELTDLEIFLSLCHTLNITATAQEVYRTPTAVGLRLKKLEQALEVELFRRHSRGLELTRAGVVLRRYARTLMEDAQKLDHALRSYRSYSRPTIRIATNSTLLQTVFSQIIGQYLREHAVRFVFSEVKTTEGIRLLKNGVVDFVFGRETILQLEKERFHVDTLFVDRHVLITPVGHPLTQKKSIAFAQTLDFPQISLPRSSAMGLAMKERCQRFNVAFEPIVEVPTFITAVELVGHGAGIAIVPKSALTGQEKVHVIALEDHWAHRPLGVAYSKESKMTSEQSSFLTFVQAYFLHAS